MRFSQVEEIDGWKAPYPAGLLVDAEDEARLCDMDALMREIEMVRRRDILLQWRKRMEGTTPN